MATLDNLEIEIKASTEKAIKSIQNLSTVITGMSKNLDPTIDGLNRMADSLLRISSIDLKDVSDTLGSLKKYAKGISDVMSPDTKGMTSATAKLQRFGDKAQEVRKAADTLARSLAKEHGFGTDEKSITKVRNGVIQMFSVYDESDKFEKAKKNLIEMVKNLGYINNKNLDHSFDGIVEDARRFRDYVKESSILLPKDWSKELGDNATAKSVRGVLGIGNSNRDKSKGINLQTWVAQAQADHIPLPSGIDETSDEMEILTKVVEKLRNEYAITQGDVSSLNNAMYNSAEVTEMVKGDVSSLSTIVRDMAADVEKVATPIQTIGEAANNAALPMDMFADALERIGDVTLSDSLQNLSFVKDAISKLGGESGGRAGEALTQIAQGIKAFDGVTIPTFGDDLTNLAVGLRKLGSKTMVNAGQSLLPIARGLWSLSNITISTDVEALSKLAYALSRFGLSSMTKAADNMPKITKGVREMASSLASLPPVSESTIRLVEAMGNLNLRTNNASNGSKKLGLSLKSLTGHMNKANKSTKSLAATIGKIYASYWLLFRLFGKLGKAITLASDLKEIQNVVDVTFGDMSKKMDDFAQNAVDTIGMSELTAKEIGSRFQAMGTNMGITDEMVKKTNDFVQTATNGYADVADSMADVSINLTRLSGDIASLFNDDYAEVGERLQSIFTGTVKPLRRYGLDLRDATLQEWAHNHGLEVKVKTMAQAEKTLLRYQYVMAQTTSAQGDFQRTIGNWANQIRIAKERLKQLGVIIGQIGIYTFKPLIVSFNKAMKTIIEGATGLLNSLGKIFGWQVEWEDGGVLQDDEEAAEGLADDMGDAADNAKKFKNFLLGIDELNLLPDNSDKDKGNGGLGGLGGALGDAMGGLNLKKTQGEFESLYDTLYKLGRRIADLLKNFLKNIDWDAVYKKARRFGKGLAQFFNGLLADAETFYQIGKALAGGVNAFANVVDAFHKEFDGWQLGVDIGNLVNGFTENLDWSVIKSAAVGAAHDLAQTINGAFVTVNWKLLGKTIAEGLNTAIDYFYTLGTEIKWSVIGTSIADAINGLFENFDFAKAAQTLSAWIKGILDTLINLLDKTNWKQIGDSIGTFISNIDFVGIASRFAELFWKAMNAAVSTWVGLFEGAPIATTIATVIATGLSNKGVRRGIGKAIGNLSDFIGSSLSKDLGNLFNGTLLKKFKGGYISSMTESIATSKLFGSKLRGISAGFNEISNSLSGVTKALGSTVVGFAEFFTVKDAIYDIVSGTDDMGKAFIELGAAVGVAGVALSALLGVPAGLLITGVTAGIAAIVGLVDALDDIRETNAIAALTKDMGEAYYTMGDLVLKFKDVSEAVTGGLDKLHGNYEKVENLKTELSGVASGYDLIVSAIESGNTITGKSMDELIGNIGEVKSAWEEYINAQYSYLIQSTMNDYQFAKSQGILTEQMEKEYLDRINALTSGRDQELSEMETLMEELSKAQRYYDEMVAQGKTGSALSFAEKQLAEATKAVLEFGSATGAVASGGVSEFENSIESLKNVKIDFSDFDSSNYDEMLTEAVGYFNQIQEAYQNSKDIIEQTVQDRMKADPTLSEEEARASVQMYFDALNSATQDSLDSLQLSIYDIWTASFNAGDEVTLAGDMKANFIIPFMEQMTGLYEEAANGEKPKLASVTNSLFRDLWENGDKGFNTMKIGDDWKNYADEYRKQLEPMSDETKRATSESGQAFKELEQQTSGSVSVIADGIESLSVVSAAFTKTNKDFRRSVQDGSGDVVSQYRNVSNAASDVAKGVGDISNAASKYDEVRRKVKVTADEFNASAEKVKALKGHVDELDGSVTTIDTDFSTMLTNLSTINTTLMEDLPVTTEAFTTFFSGIQTDAENVLTWFTETFEKHFTSQYWETALAGVGIGFHNAFNTAIEAVKGIWTLFATWAKENMKIKIPKTKLPNGKETEEIDLSVKVGSFYNGGFPEDGFFFANHSEMVGQFSNGKTAVANNDQIVEGIKQGVYEAVSAAWSSQSGGGNVTVEITGDASDIFRAVVRENDRSIMRTGASPIRV